MACVKATGVSVALVARHSCAEAVERCVDSVTRCRSDEDVSCGRARLDDFVFFLLYILLENGFFGFWVQLQEAYRGRSARRLLRSGQNLNVEYPHPQRFISHRLSFELRNARVASLGHTCDF